MKRSVIRQAGKSDLPWIKSLLEENRLPTIGVDEWFENFMIALDETGSRVGVAGIEVYNHNALLRSVAVDKTHRRSGYGRIVVDVVLKHAKSKGVDTIYLYTEDAQDYFKALGFDVVDRSLVDEVVKGSPELAKCCSGATAMHKSLQ
ncbi:MAG TPA: GNAT family N-acetyltransferase [Terriglobales bacterium]|nr:GNAT family N-acetyltransferase [Terriglobales bacterium]